MIKSGNVALLFLSLISANAAHYGDNNKPTSNDGTINENEDLLQQKLTNILVKLETDSQSIHKMIGNGRQYVVFDCKQPSYLDRDHNLVIIKQKIQSNNPETIEYTCNQKTNLWSIGHEGYISFNDQNQQPNGDATFEILTKEIYIRNYFQKKLMTKNIQLTNKDIDGIIDLIFYLTHHPSHYTQNFNRKRSHTETLLTDQLFEKIAKVNSSFDKNLIGNGFNFILYDCKEPKFLYPKKDSKYLNESDFEVRKPTETLMKSIAHQSYCDERDQMWKSSKQPVDEIYASYIAVDASKLGSLKLGYSPKASLLIMLQSSELCDEFMKVFLHPSYWNENFTKPAECSKDLTGDVTTAPSKLSKKSKSGGIFRRIFKKKEAKKSLSKNSNKEI